MAIKNNYISPVNGELSVTPVENPVCVYTSYLGGSDVISSDEMNSYKTAKLVNPLGDRISLSLPDDSRQTAPDTTFPLYDDTRTYGFNSATLMPADPADELSFLSYALTVKDRNGVRAFTDIDFKRCLLSGSISYDEVDGKKRYSVCETFTLKYAYGEKTSFLDTNGSISDVEPVVLFTKDNGYYGLELRSMRVSCHYTEITFDKTSNLGPDTTDFGYGTFIERLKRRAIWKAYERGMYPYDGYTEHQTVENMTYSIYHGGSSSGNNTNVVGYLNNEHDALLLIAGAGLAFEVDGVIYKPIVQGGVVVDFTSDMNEKSEWDEWTDFGSRTLPDAPGGGGGGDDGFTPNEYRITGDVNGLGRFYLMSGTQLDSLSDAIKSAPLGFDLRNSLISCYAIPNDGGLVDAPVPSTIKFRLGGVGVEKIEVWDTKVSANRISSSAQGTILGRVQIPRPTETFLDFEPYTSLELYVPFCGWCTLPPSLCVGKEIVVKLYTNVPLCSCRVVIEVGGCAVAHMQGVWGSLVPFTSDGSAIKNAEVTKNVIDVLGSAIIGVTGGIAGSEMGIAAGITGAIGNATQAGINSRKNYGYYVGSSGDSTTFNMGNRCWYKLVYPEPDIPSSYGHVVGYICNKTMSIKNGMGFTIIDDPRINVNCTDVERDELRELLLKGVIF